MKLTLYLEKLDNYDAVFRRQLRSTDIRANRAFSLSLSRSEWAKLGCPVEIEKEFTVSRD